MRFRSLMTIGLLALAANVRGQNAPASDAATTTDVTHSVTSIVPDGKPHKFEARDRQFFIDGQPTLIVAGEMHFGRVLPEDWETRIKQAKAMGLNTVSFYLFWNLCEPQEGQFNLTGMTDVRHVLQLCQANGMWAILRPGPYCCAEEEYGGIPYWTLKYPDVKIRSTDPKWLEWSKAYIEQVGKQVGDLQVEKGGPLLMVQMDNEFGMIAAGDNSYMEALHKIFVDAGFSGQLFTCDPGGGGRGGMPGVMNANNGYKAGAGRRGGRGGLGGGGRLGGPAAPAAAPAVAYPRFVSETYTNWFTGWGQPLATRFQSIDEIVNWTNGLIKEGDSFNYYVFFGGTNFGFMNGCNEYLPVHTSYDYGAPIDEAGRTTEKYRALRAALIEDLKITPPEPPADPAVIEIPAFTLDRQAALLDTLPDKPTRTAAEPVAMENLDQDYGFVDYRKQFAGGLKGTLVLKDPMDYAIVMVNGKTVGKAFRGLGEESKTIALPETTGAATLDILVYNLGRISVITAPWTQDRARKGLIGGATLDGNELKDWEMFSLPEASVSSATTPGLALKRELTSAEQAGPSFYRGTFKVDKTGGSFLDMRNWSMGVVWVNGHNLGRYWDRGALRSLFVPGPWLKQGENEIVVLELNDWPKTPEISGAKNLIAEAPMPFPVRLDAPASFPPRGGRGGGGRGAGAATN